MSEDTLQSIPLPSDAPGVARDLSLFVNALTSCGIRAYAVYEILHSTGVVSLLEAFGCPAKSHARYQLTLSNGTKALPLKPIIGTSKPALMTDEELHLIFDELPKGILMYSFAKAATRSKPMEPSLLVLYAGADTDDPSAQRQISDSAEILANALAADSANRSLTFLRHAMSSIDAMYRAVVHKDSMKEFNDTASLVVATKDLANAIATKVSALLRLSRCAILFPTEEDPSQWFYIGECGQSGQASTSVVTQGQGLTGSVLKCGPKDFVHTADIESDPSWSRRFGRIFMRNERELSGVPLAFLGLPIYPRHGAMGKGPTAALIMIRPMSNDGRLSSFHEDELYIYQHLAGSIAYALDAMSARLHSQHEADWFERLVVLENEAIPDKIYYSHLLEHFTTAFPAMKSAIALLSACDPHSTVIRGVAVTGRATEKLADETIRVLWDTEPADSSKEDSLSRLIRLRYRQPVAVSPGKNDEFACTLQPETTARHGLHSEHLFIPLIDGSDRHCGAIIVVSEVVSSWADAVSFTVVERFARHIGAALGRRLTKSEKLRRNAVEIALLSAFSAISEAEPIDPHLRETLEVLCTKYRFSNAVLYRYDSGDRLLRGCVGHNVNDKVLKNTIYAIDTDSPRGGARSSLAMAILLTQSKMFLETVTNPIVDSHDRVEVGIQSDCWAFGVPVVNNGHIHGVLIVFGTNECVPKHKTPRFTENYEQWLLQNVGVRIGAVLNASEEISRGGRDRRVRLSQATIMQQIEGLLRSATPTLRIDSSMSDDVLGYAVEIRKQLDAMIVDCANVFGAQVAGLFVSEVPDESEFNVGGTPGVSGDRAYWLVAGTGYRDFAYFTSGKSDGNGHATPDISLKYSSTERSLTSHVLRTRMSHRTPDVERDRRWSGKGEHFLQIFGDRDAHRDALPTHNRRVGDAANGYRSRSWLGVPLCIEDGNARSIYGALTFTRFTDSSRDRRAFSEQDAAVARSIGTLIAMLFQHRREVTRIRRILGGFLRTFQHDGVGDLIGMVLSQLRSINRKGNGAGTLIANPVGKESAYVYEFLEFAQSVFSAFTSYVSANSRWDASREYRLDALLSPVMAVARQNADSLGVGLVVDVNDWGVEVVADRSKLRYIVFAVLRNALKSCYLRGGEERFVKFAVSIADGNMKIVVTDNGVGLGDSLGDECFAEGFTRFPGGTGLGLSIVRKFLASCVLEFGRGSCVLRSGSHGGAVFEASIPIAKE